jgi:hypothetical protein
MNTMFYYKDSHKYTWSARGQRCIIDYIICNENLFTMLLEVRCFLGPEKIESDHFLVDSKKDIRLDGTKDSLFLGLKILIIH